MNAVIQFESDTKVKLTVSVDAKELAVAEKLATEKLARNVKVAGFRKGKTPVSVAAKNIDPDTLQNEIINNALNSAVAEAFISNKLQALDRPVVSVTKYVPGELLEFTAETEVLPQVKLGNYKKLKTKVEKITVAESEIDEIVERMRSGFAEKADVKRAAANGDEVIIDFIGKKDDVAFEGGTGKEYPLKLGSNQFIPGFEEGIVGHKTGETFDLNLTFPADYGAKDLQNAKVTFETTIKAVKEIKLAPLDDKFAAKAGPFKNVDELKADIKRELIARKEQEASEKRKDDLIKQLVAASKVPVPEILIEDQTKSIEQDFVNNLMYQGLNLDQYLENKGFKSKEEWLASEVRDVAIKRVQSGLILAELSKAEKITATEDEINQRVDVYKQQYAKNPESLKQFEKPEVRQDIANRLLTDKTIDRLVDLNTK